MTKMFIAPVRAFRNCFKSRYFTTQERGIGYSFQLAITAPLYSITGYCIATAQSWWWWKCFSPTFQSSWTQIHSFRL